MSSHQFGPGCFAGCGKTESFAGERRRQRDLRDIAGTWQSDRDFDRALAEQDSIDRELWQ
jgi:hypothetical protein